MDANQQAQSSGSATSAAAPLETFAQNLLIEKGVADLDASLVAGMKQDILERLELLSTKVVLNALTENDAAQFERMVDAGASSEELQKFTDEHVPDLSQRMTEALLRFRLMYLGTTT